MHLQPASLKMASRNRLLPVWSSHLGNTRAGIYTWWGIHVGGKGVLSLPQAKKIKFKDFQSCLPTLPAYFPLKFPYGQFPLKIPGPISQTKFPPKFFFFLNGGVAIKLLLVNLITFLANTIRLVVAAPI